MHALTNIPSNAMVGLIICSTEGAGNTQRESCDSKVVRPEESNTHERAPKHVEYQVKYDANDSLYLTGLWIFLHQCSVKQSPEDMRS